MIRRGAIAVDDSISCKLQETSSNQFIASPELLQSPSESIISLIAESLIDFIDHHIHYLMIPWTSL